MTAIKDRFYPLMLVAAGGALGVIVRYLIDDMIRIGAVTTVSNILGCFLFGFISSYVRLKEIDKFWYRPLIQIGFFGSFTSFSVLSLYFYSQKDGLMLNAFYFAALLLAYVFVFVAGSLGARVWHRIRA